MKRKSVTPTMGIMSPDDLARLLTVAPPNLRVPLAIAAFAGLRSNEIERLTVEDIDFAKGYILVPSRWTKTGRSRSVPLADNLRAWLDGYLPKQGPICHVKSVMSRVRQLAAQIGIGWSPNLLRRSCVGYQLALDQSSLQQALGCGVPAIPLQARYWESSDRQTAAKWFSIRPDETGCAAATAAEDNLGAERAEQAGIAG